MCNVSLSPQGDLCVHAAVTLRAGGCVLCPVYPSGVLYDLLECLSAHLDTAGLQHVPMYVVSPVADSSLAYSNILAEWVSVGKQVRITSGPVELVCAGQKEREFCKRWESPATLHKGCW